VINALTLQLSPLFCRPSSTADIAQDIARKRMASKNLDNAQQILNMAHE